MNDERLSGLYIEMDRAYKYFKFGKYLKINEEIIDETQQRIGEAQNEMLKNILQEELRRLNGMRKFVTKWILINITPIGRRYLN